MSAKKRITELRRMMEGQEQQEIAEICTCTPLASYQSIPDSASQDEQQIVSTTPQVQYLLRTRLQELLPHVTSVSTLLLHVSQQKHSSLYTHDKMSEQSRRYHVTPDVLVQIMNNVRRAIRMRDDIYIAEGIGAVLLFPEVDEQGIYNIMERVYNSICLLQAETIVPPLTHVTDIVLGCGTYRAAPDDTWSANADTSSRSASRSRSSASRREQHRQQEERALEDLLIQTGKVARQLLLRPALTMSLWETMPEATSTEASRVYSDRESSHSRRYEEPVENVETTERFLSLSSLSPLPDAAPVGSIVPVGSVADSHEMANMATHHPLPIISQGISVIPFLQLPSRVPPRLKHLVPYMVAEHLRCVPVGRDHHTVTVAMADPTDEHAIQRLREITGMMIFPVSCELEALLDLLAEEW